MQYHYLYNFKIFLVSDVQHVMHHCQVGISKRMVYCFVRMITGQNMESHARTVDRYENVNMLKVVQ